MKHIGSKFRSFGRFYKKHRQMLFFAKMVIVSGIAGTLLTLSSPHTSIFSTYAGDLCGNDSCDYVGGYCSISDTRCGVISAGSCTSVDGCSLVTQDTYTCGGTSFSCAAATVLGKPSCINLGCFWDSDTSSCTNDGQGKTANESCSALNNSVSCSLGGDSIGDCSWEVSGTTDTCQGTISEPEDDSSCAALGLLGKPLGFGAIWIAAYDENVSCPADCSEDLCGNAICDDIAGSCEVDTTDCGKISTGSCASIAGCSSVGSVSTYACQGTTFSCAALTIEPACNSVNCSWDKGSSSCSEVLDDKGNPKQIYTCANLGNQIACEYVTSNGGADCVWTGGDITDICTGTIHTGELNENDCESLNTFSLLFGASWSSGYVEDSDSCIADCGVPSFCGDGTQDEGEACDDGNDNDNDACSNACVAQDYIVSYTPDGDITVVQGEGVYYDSKNSGFFVPRDIHIFMFTDGGVILGYGGNVFAFVVSYTANGDIDNIAPEDSVAWTNDYSLFALRYSGSITPPVTGFTFVDSGISMIASYSGSSWNFTEDDVVVSVCGNKQVEDGEVCDDGEGGTCKDNCLYEASCGNNIIEQGETCDQGIFNGKPGQCNSSCDGMTSYKFSCGDGACSSYCDISGDITCDSLNEDDDHKGLCGTFGCFLQTRNLYECNGTVSCEKITKTNFYNDDYMAQKYCTIAGCSRDSKTSICSNGGKTVSCSNPSISAAEYCKMLAPVGCSLTTDGTSTSCLGDGAARPDKLNQDQCSIVGGTRTVETTETCPGDCKETCGTNATISCVEISLDDCSSYYSSKQDTICIEKQGKCTEGTLCTTCGNGICEESEDYASCATDCIISEPTISYSPKDPGNGQTVESPVKATIALPEGCSLLNNGGKDIYTFNYNSYFLFQVSCPRYSNGKVEIGAKVYWIGGKNKDIKAPSNITTMVSTASGITLYCANEAIITTTTETTLAYAKKSIFESSLKNSTGVTTFSDKVALSNTNLSFENGAKIETKIALSQDLSGTATKATIYIPEGTLKVEKGDTTTDFTGVFVAPYIVTGEVVSEFNSQLQNINKTADLVLKVGDEETNKLTIESGDEQDDFIIEIEDITATGSVDVFYSQDGITWTFYGVTSVIDGTVAITVPHLTYYGIVSDTESTGDEVISTPSGGSNGGGGGGSILIKDICPAQRDCSDSYYDQLCGPCLQTGSLSVYSGRTISITPDNEQMIAYQYAFLHNITSKSYDQARLYDGVTRGEMAKMISNFAKNILGEKPDTTKVCVFEDNISGSKEDKAYIIQACQLGLMGLESDGVNIKKNFDPSRVLTRAEFGTIFSRLLYGGLYNTEVGSSIPYYGNHLATLKQNGVMTKIETPFASELRGFVMLMMLRADLKDDGLLTLPAITEDDTSIKQRILNFLNSLF